MRSVSRVLVVDDSEDVRNIFSCLVQSVTGEAPSQAASAAEALMYVQFSRREGRPFDLVLLDIRMPEMSGNEAAAELRKAGFHGVIAGCTAAISGLGRREALDSGIDHYFDKTKVTKDVIQALLDEASKRKETTSGSPRE